MREVKRKGERIVRKITRARGKQNRINKRAKEGELQQEKEKDLGKITFHTFIEIHFIQDFCSSLVEESLKMRHICRSVDIRRRGRGIQMPCQMAGSDDGPNGFSPSWQVIKCQQTATEGSRPNK